MHTHAVNGVSAIWAWILFLASAAIFIPIFIWSWRGRTKKSRWWMYTGFIGRYYSGRGRILFPLFPVMMTFLLVFSTTKFGGILANAVVGFAISLIMFFYILRDLFDRWCWPLRYVGMPLWFGATSYIELREKRPVISGRLSISDSAPDHFGKVFVTFKVEELIKPQNPKSRTVKAIIGLFENGIVCRRVSNMKIITGEHEIIPGVFEVTWEELEEVGTIKPGSRLVLSWGGQKRVFKVAGFEGRRLARRIARDQKRFLAGKPAETYYPQLVTTQ